MAKKFLVGVGNVNCYDVSTGDLLFTSKTMLDDSIDVSTASAEVRAGKGNALQYVYYHTGKMDVTFTEAQFSLNLISMNMGSAIQTGKNVWSEETVILGTGGTGSVLGTPVVSPDVTTTIYGWVTDKTGLTTKVTFTGKNFTLAGGNSGDSVCVRYYNNNSAARYVQISSNFIPSIVRCVIDAQLGSSDSTTNIIGNIQIEIPRLQISGSQNIGLKADGVSNTPLKGSALAFNDTASGACASAGYYATITEILNSANWYDQVQFLTLTADPISLSSANSPLTVDLRAVPLSGSAFKVSDYSQITWTSSDATKFTVSNGILTKVATGTANLTYTITGKISVTGQTIVNVS